jgi:hypothetical protein
MVSPDSCFVDRWVVLEKSKIVVTVALVADCARGDLAR